MDELRQERMELLPVDNDRRWLPLSNAHGVRLGRAGNAYRAARELQWALARGLLRCLCLDGGAQSLVLPSAWGSLVALAVSEDRVFVFDRGTGIEISNCAFYIWGPDLDDVRWHLAPPDVVAEPASDDRDRPYRRPPPGTKITRYTVIHAIVDHDLRHIYPDGVPPDTDTTKTSPRRLQDQCEQFWDAASDALGANKWRLPTWPVFKEYIAGRR